VAHRHTAAGVLEGVEIVGGDRQQLVRILVRVEHHHRGQQLGERGHRRDVLRVLFDQHLAGRLVDDEGAARMQRHLGGAAGPGGEQQGGEQQRAAKRSDGHGSVPVITRLSAGAGAS